MDSEQDSKLVREVLQGHHRAFEEIVDRYKKPVFNVAFRMTGDASEAEDVTQAVFVKAYENLSCFNLHRKFFSWLYRIAINEALNAKHARKAGNSICESVISDDKNPYELLHEKDRCHTIDVALKKLNDDYRLVIVLRHFQDLSYSEIAEILQVPEKTVKSRLFTARQQLREILIRSEIV